MMKLEPKHWMIIGLGIAGIATQLATAQHGWTDVATPGFVAGVLLQISAIITGIFSGAPGAAQALADSKTATALQARYPDEQALPGASGGSASAPPYPSRGGASVASKLMLALMLLGSLAASSGCATAQNNPTLTPQAVTAKNATSLVTRLGELQDAVIAESQAGRVALPDAKAIVSWISGDQHHVDSNTGQIVPLVGLVQVIQATPGGWLATALSGYAAVRPRLLNSPTLVQWVTVLDGLIGVVQ